MLLKIYSVILVLTLPHLIVYEIIIYPFAQIRYLVIPVYFWDVSTLNWHPHIGFVLVAS